MTNELPKRPIGHWSQKFRPEGLWIDTSRFRRAAERGLVEVERDGRTVLVSEETARLFARPMGEAGRVERPAA